MYQLTQLADDRRRQRLAHAGRRRPRASARSRWPGPPAAPSAPNATCAAPPARPGGCAPSSGPKHLRSVTTRPPRRQPQPQQHHQEVTMNRTRHSIPSAAWPASWPHWPPPCWPPPPRPRPRSPCPSPPGAAATTCHRPRCRPSSPAACPAGRSPSSPCRRGRGRRRRGAPRPGPGRPPAPARTQRLTCADTPAPGRVSPPRPRGRAPPSRPPSRAATITTHPNLATFPAASTLTRACRTPEPLPSPHQMRSSGPGNAQRAPATTAPADRARTGRSARNQTMPPAELQPCIVGRESVGWCFRPCFPGFDLAGA